MRTHSIFFLCLLDIDDCKSGYCLNGGTCNDKVNDYECDCVLGWKGKRCQTSKTQYFLFILNLVWQVTLFKGHEIARKAVFQTFKVALCEKKTAAFFRNDIKRLT